MSSSCLSRRSFFSQAQGKLEDTYEQIFFLVRYGQGLDGQYIEDMSFVKRQWFVRRLVKAIKDEAEERKRQQKESASKGREIGRAHV